MKILLRGLLNYHLIPILAAIVILFIADHLLVRYGEYESTDQISISGTAVSIRGIHSNCESEQSEIELIGSLRSENNLTIMGSSELQGLPYSSCYFLPDSAGIPAVAFGHGYHQNLSIACELLAAGKELEGANVCILLSPGWFESGGTNIEAFLEFVRPNFLRSIIHDESIPDVFKMRIARYVFNQYEMINNPSSELIYFKNLYSSQHVLGVPVSLRKAHVSRIKQVRYQVQEGYNYVALQTNKDFDITAARKRQEAAFLKTCSNNSIYVDSSYFSNYLMAKGEYKKGKMHRVELGEEFDDFLLVVAILRKYKCHATFVLQPLHPYHFDDLNQLNTVRKAIKMELDACGFPLLDMFVTDTTRYTPGILTDVMHPGNRGWIDINEFLINNYRK